MNLSQWRSRALACCLALLAVAGVAAPAPEAAASASAAEQDGAAPPGVRDVAISPSGKHLALIVYSANGHYALATMDLDPLGNMHMVAAFEDADIDTVAWVNDERLVYTTEGHGYGPRGNGGTVWASDRDGSAPRQLLDGMATETSRHELAGRWNMGPVIDDGGDEIFASMQEKRGLRIVRLDTHSGLQHTVDFDLPGHVTHWLVDAHHEVRMLTAEAGGREKVYWRKDAGSAWQEVADFDAVQQPLFVPWAIGEDGQVYVRAHQGADTTGIYRFDPVSRKLAAEPEVRAEGFDVDPEFTGDGGPRIDSRTGQLLGLRVLADRPVNRWFDARLDRLQRGVDAALPDHDNELLCGRCTTSRFFVVKSSSDRQPGEYFLYDSDKGALQRIGAMYPGLDPQRSPPRSFQYVTARDGLRIPLYVTRPLHVDPARKPAAVVLVHGGPFLRETDWRWEFEPALLASRGYVVLQPQFRGTTGFGMKLFQAGWKHWGDTMQDDLADAVHWAGAQGLIDPSRVCIVGGSYGGYAALMSPIVHPGLYRCAVAFAAPTDIDLLYTVSGHDISEEALRYGMPVMIGDRHKDADMLRRASPLRRVDEFKVPLLLLHGAQDERVPIEQEREFAEAARKAGVNLEEKVYLDSAHGPTDPQAWADYVQRMPAFLAKWLKPKAAARPRAAVSAAEAAASTASGAP